MIKEIVEKMLEKSYLLEMGAGKLAKRFGCSIEEIKAAKEKARQSAREADQELDARAPLAGTADDQKATFTGGESTVDGMVKRYVTTKPLSPKEIEELVGVDNVTTYVAKVLDKSLANGNWTYSVDIRYRVKNFYSTEELQKRLAEIFPKDIKPFKTTKVSKGQRAITIMIADDHCGAVNGKSLYENSYTPENYGERLQKIAQEVLQLGEIFEELHIISLGDQLNGWNEETTRGGHKIASLTNKDQFDIYTTARRTFYDTLFSSGVANKYYVHDVENSNHSGKDFSYMANKYLEMYLSARFPAVERKSYFMAVNEFQYGIHTIAFGHGKDEMHMKRPMPLKLDPKTDLFLFQYFDKKRMSPQDRRITFYKGDLHSYAVDKGKFGRYVNVPSMMGANDYSEVNFGNNEAGAVIEIFRKDSATVATLPIWF